MADIGLSAFSVFFMGSPSFLAHQRALEEGQGRSNCQTLFGMTAVPSDAYIRLMLDGASPAAFDPLFFKTIETEGVLAPFQRLGGRTLIALDGTEHFCSRKIHCKRCSTRRRSDGGIEYFHSFLGASIVAPGHTRVLPLPPEFVAPQDGAEKQDCERNAAKRWLARHGPAVAQLRPVYLGDDLFACQPIAEAIHRWAAASSSPASQRRTRPCPNTCTAPRWKSIAGRRKSAAGGPRRFTAGSPRCRCAPPMTRWPSPGSPSKSTTPRVNPPITTASSPIWTSSPGNVAELAACGRARWKIENETFNVLKTNGYNLEHNFGHGKETLASVLVVLNLLAFGFHTAAMLAVLAWRQAVIARGATYRFFEHLRTITAYVIFQDWDHLLRSITAAAIRPP
jgi:hypothetical protein